jgi:hypothetical protein
VSILGLASAALVLSIAAPFGGNWWYGITLISPAAGAYYLRKGDREEEVPAISSPIATVTVTITAITVVTSITDFYLLLQPVPMSWYVHQVSFAIMRTAMPSLLLLLSLTSNLLLQPVPVSWYVHQVSFAITRTAMMFATHTRPQRLMSSIPLHMNFV